MTCLSIYRRRSALIGDGSGRTGENDQGRRKRSVCKCDPLSVLLAKCPPSAHLKPVCSEF